jgi:hypothetical protein
MSATADSHRGACRFRRRRRANRVHGPGGQHARGAWPRLSARELAAAGRAGHPGGMLRRLALVRRDRAAESRLGLQRLPELPVSGSQGHDSRRGADAGTPAGSVLARTLLGQLLPGAALVRAALVLGASAPAALSTPESSSAVPATRGAPATSDCARAASAGSPVAAHDSAGALATRSHTTPAPTPGDRTSGFTCAHATEVCAAALQPVV